MFAVRERERWGDREKEVKRESLALTVYIDDDVYRELLNEMVSEGVWRWDMVVDGEERMGN